ncbi:rsbT co-antagonist protein RsbR [Peribacillus deserti]|uniref:RsbT co-antagonist protein RsbR n=1 Tax=Peribacillus deserti TaxID=673318 RepID=A0ABS2QGR2_9BACI|nr:STAS domain-containing protein [Peribacillus deserti]MBM7692205.1 rsbT co-antagonist protein RsbR [Peribacillus deserti]
MVRTVEEVTNYLDADQNNIADVLLEQAIVEMGLTLKDEETNKYKDLLVALISHISKSLRLSKSDRKKINFSFAIDHYSLNKGSTQTELIDLLCNFRLGLLKEIRKRCISQKLPLEEIFFVNDQVVYTFDEIIRNITRISSIITEKSVKAIEKEMLELAAPIVPIKRGVAVLPFIGDFNENRAAYIMETVIPKVARLDLNMLIIDFSGIHVFDTFVAQHFFQIRDILKLLGISPVITGIRPALAQTAVQLGINIADVQAYSNVQQVLEKKK